MRDAEEIYADIIEYEYKGPAHHRRMSPNKRAAQFIPFAALTGFGDATDETARLTERRRVLTESKREELDEKIAACTSSGAAEQARTVEITYFLPDLHKDGGSYVTCRGKIRKTDPYARTLMMEDGTCIPAEDVWDIRME